MNYNKTILLITIFLVGIFGVFLGIYLSTLKDKVPADHYFIDLNHDGIIDARIMPIDTKGRLRAEILVGQEWIEVHLTKDNFQWHKATRLSDQSHYIFENGKWQKTSDSNQVPSGNPAPPSS